MATAIIRAAFALHLLYEGLPSDTVFLLMALGYRRGTLDMIPSSVHEVDFYSRDQICHYLQHSVMDDLEVLARTLTFDSLWRGFVTSVSENRLYIFWTMFWVYWGVCISDMIPFYAGRFAAQTKAGDTLRKKVGLSEEKLKMISQSVQRFRNLIGFVERFWLGVRNPTAFVAGAMGVSPDKFFTGVCLGALITMPLQMGVGCALREHPVKASAGVAAAIFLLHVWFILAGKELLPPCTLC
ncbi:hypothetical protein L7F22_027065 [Adiantum nelumboides]|nr:hypothetical protein [Adiantum nelumboides]